LRKKLKKSVGILPADCARPAAKDQLLTLAKKIEIPAFDSPIQKGALEVCAHSIRKRSFF
jgi:signal recognition particle GTPase